MKMNRFNRFYKWARSLSVGSERARRYSLPDLPRGDQLPAFLARSARPWQTPRHRRARVRRTPGVRDDFATGADSARNRSGGRW